MKREIDKLLEQGHLKKFLRVKEPRREREREKESVRERISKQTKNPPQDGTRMVINIIFGGDSLGRDSLIRKKAHFRHVFVMSTNKLLPYQPITFTPKDRESVA